MSRWTLTIRHASSVERERYQSLDDAVAELRRRAEEISSEADGEEISAVRTFAPEGQVQARLEISTGSLLRRHDAGVDVRGDGSVMAFSGGLRREELAPRRGQSPYEAVRAVLRKAAG